VWSLDLGLGYFHQKPNGIELNQTEWPRAESADLKVAYVGGASTNFRSLLLICFIERHRDFYPCTLTKLVSYRFWLAAQLRLHSAAVHSLPCFSGSLC
jgi:hypothetical protein